MKTEACIFPSTTPTETTLVLALERLAQVVRVLLWDKAQQHGLSPIQLQALMYLGDHPADKRRVSALAREFDLRPATVSDVVKVLEKKGLLDKATDEKDGRAVILSPSLAGKKLIHKLSDWPKVIYEQFKHFSIAEKAMANRFLLELITKLQESGVIQVARMCTSCSNFQRDLFPGTKRPHHCNLTDQRLADAELKMNCPTFEGGES